MADDHVVQDVHVQQPPGGDRLRGEVEVVGAGVAIATVLVVKNAGGAEIRGVAVTGAKVGIGVSGSSERSGAGAWKPCIVASWIGSSWLPLVRDIAANGTSPAMI